MTLALTSRRAALAPGPWVRNELWRRARAVPSLDLRFAENKSLVDATTGSNLVTFTRASSGTFVGSDGLLQTATTNLLLRSEEFETTWTKDANSVLTTNVGTAPNGTTTGDKFAVGTSTFPQIAQNVTSNNAATHTFSVYMKADGLSFVQIRARNQAATTNFFRAVFNLSTGVASLAGGSGNGSLASATATNVGDGWWRCAITGIADTTGTNIQPLAILSTDANGTVATPSNSNATDGILFWGAQLEQSSTVGEYIPTTSTINSAPRFDHNPTTGESLGLLVEEARTNLLLRSEEFDNASWTKTRSSITANTIVAPNGTLTADKLVESTINGEHYTEQSIIPAAGTYTHTVFAKAGEYNQLRIRPVHIGEAFTTSAITFDLTTGPTATTNNLITNATMQILPNGWRRCSVTFTLTSAASSHSMRIQLLNADGSSVYTGDDVSGIYLWGAQLEAGAFPTSYIPTTTATVTRSADVASISGSNFSSWYRQDEGTVFARYSFPQSPNTAGARVFQFTSTAGSSVIWLRAQAGVNRIYDVTDTNVSQATFNQGAYAAGAEYRGALAFRLNDFGFAENGGASQSDSSGTVPVMDRLGIGIDSGGFSPGNTHIRRLTYWPTRLPDSTLQAVTQ